jgi:hypothetical protein
MLALASAARGQDDPPLILTNPEPPGVGPKDQAGPTRGPVVPVTNVAGGAVFLFDPVTPTGVEGKVPFGYALEWVPRRPVVNSDRDLGVLRQDAAVRFPVYNRGPDLLIGGIGVRNTLFTGDAVFPRGRDVPDSLWDIRGSLTYLRQLDAGWAAGGSVTVGSPSDKPFHSAAEVVPTLNAFLRVPAAREPDAWLFALFYSPVGEIRFPIPAAAYLWNPSDNLQLTLGLPLAVTWKPTDTLRVDAGYLPLRRVKAQVTWAIRDGFEAFGGYEWANDPYLRAGRLDNKEQLFVYEMRVPGGVRLFLRDHWVFDAAAGWAFQRELFNGRTYSDRRFDGIRVEPGVFAQFRLAYRF